MSGRTGGWPEHKRLRNRLVLSVFGPQALVLVSWLALPTSAFLSHTYWIALGFFDFGWLVLFLAAVAGLSKWPCPQCGERFDSWRHGLGIFARRCHSCGLPKYANSVQLEGVRRHPL